MSQRFGLNWSDKTWSVAMVWPGMTRQGKDSRIELVRKGTSRGHGMVWPRQGVSPRFGLA